jgi:hypothetical protein
MKRIERLLFVVGFAFSTAPAHSQPYTTRQIPVSGTASIPAPGGGRKFPELDPSLPDRGGTFEPIHRGGGNGSGLAVAATSSRIASSNRN